MQSVPTNITLLKFALHKVSDKVEPSKCKTSRKSAYLPRECVRILDMRVLVHPGVLWVSKQRVHIVLEASKSVGAKGDVPKICGFVHPLHPL